MVKKLLLCHNSLRNHVVILMGTIAPSSLGVGSFPSPYGYVGSHNTMPPERKAGERLGGGHPPRLPGVAGTCRILRGGLTPVYVRIVSALQRQRAIVCEP